MAISQDNTNLDTDAALTPFQSMQAVIQSRALPSARKISPVAKLNQTTSNPPTQAEVQAIANAIDALIDALDNGGYML